MKLKLQPKQWGPDGFKPDVYLWTGSSWRPATHVKDGRKYAYYAVLTGIFRVLKSDVRERPMGK